MTNTETQVDAHPRDPDDQSEQKEERKQYLRFAGMILTAMGQLLYQLS